MHFETYEPFNYLIFKLFLGCAITWITENGGTETVDTGACLCMVKVATNDIIFIPYFPM
jgi:hypothetical protein